MAPIQQQRLEEEALNTYVQRLNEQCGRMVHSKVPKDIEKHTTLTSPRSTPTTIKQPRETLRATGSYRHGESSDHARSLANGQEENPPPGFISSAATGDTIEVTIGSDSANPEAKQSRIVPRKARDSCEQRDHAESPQCIPLGAPRASVKQVNQEESQNRVSRHEMVDIGASSLMQMPGEVEHERLSSEKRCRNPFLQGDSSSDENRSSRRSGKAIRRCNLQSNEIPSPTVPHKDVDQTQPKTTTFSTDLHASSDIQTTETPIEFDPARNGTEARLDAESSLIRCVDEQSGDAMVVDQPITNLLDRIAQQDSMEERFQEPADKTVHSEGSTYGDEHGEGNQEKVLQTVCFESKGMSAIQSASTASECGTSATDHRSDHMDRIPEPATLRERLQVSHASLDPSEDRSASAGNGTSDAARSRSPEQRGYQSTTHVTQREPSPIRPDDLYHYRYEVHRKEWRAGEDESQQDWYTLDEVYMTLEDANAAAKVEAESVRENGVAVNTNADSYGFDSGESGMHRFNATLGDDRMKVEVTRKLYLPRDAVSPSHKQGWLRKCIYLIQVRTTMTMVTESNDADALFQEPEEVSQTNLETVGDVYTNMEEANKEAGRVALERTTTARSKRIVDVEHRERVQKRLRKTLDALDESGGTFRELFNLSNERKIEVWVEERSLRGPRNI